MKNWGDYQKTFVYLMNNVAAIRWAPMKEAFQIGDRWAVAVQEVILQQKDAKTALDEAVADSNAMIKKAGYVK
jgi:ABC-type glycerol-3-phosphate transport system substrate-binding protein